MEGAISIAEGFTWNTSDVNEGYSVDQCLECTPGTMGCQGGWPWLCFDHIIENGGIDSEKDWPYLSESCDAAKEKFEKVAAISAYKNISDGDEEGLRRALVQQPVSIGVRANCDAFMHYGGGVLDEDCGGGERQIDHAILAVGYNLTAKTPYYIVKNSWGSGVSSAFLFRFFAPCLSDCFAGSICLAMHTNSILFFYKYACTNPYTQFFKWGEDGYVRMKVGDNLDCIACKATYPVSAKEQPPQPPTPEIKCPTGTFDPSLKEPPTCPKGSNCCCGRNYFWKKGQCKDTFCCLEDEVCYNQFGKHGCYKKSQNVSSSA